MYQAFTFYHSLLRWLVLISLVYAIVRAAKGYFSKGTYTASDDMIRRVTTGIAHVQLIVGMVFYYKSPLVSYFWVHRQMVFYGLVHPLLMIAAVVLMTVGAARVKRVEDQKKFRTLLLFFSIALLLIFVAIPWPFSPFAKSPYFR